jgi:hypothetical protein
VPYKLSDAEAALYKAATECVCEEFNRAEALEENKRAAAGGLRSDHSSAPEHFAVVRQHSRSTQFTA